MSLGQGDSDDDWRLDAACFGTFNPAFFISRGESSRPAKAICSSCPVRAECLDYAVKGEGLSYGIWGGKSERERRVVKKRRREAD